MYLFYIAAVTYYHKFSATQLPPLRVLQVNSTGGLCCFLCAQPHKVKSKVPVSLGSLSGGSGGGCAPRLTQVVGRTQFCVGVGRRSPFSCSQLGASLLAVRAPVSLTTPPPGPHHLQTSNAASSPSHSSNLSPSSFCHIFLTLTGESSLLFKGLCDQTGLAQIIHDNLPILRFITLITSAKFLSPCKVTNSQGPEIRIWGAGVCGYSAYHVRKR